MEKLTKEEYKELRRLYEEAKSAKVKSFKYKERTWVTAYAGFIIDYLRDKNWKEDEQQEN